VHYKLGGKRQIAREVSPQMLSHLKRLREYFGNSRASRIGGRDIEQFIAQLNGENKANATINRSLQLLSQAYSLAVSADPQKLSRAPKIEKLDESGNRPKGKFTQAEADLVAVSLPPYMADVARFAYETGARASEILQLRWTMLDGDALQVPGEITKNREPNCRRR
jgi:integrase